MSGPTASDDPRAGLLVVLDVDSTLVEDEVIELIADEAGVRDEVARVTAAAMRGELDFAGSLRRRVALLDGLPATALDAVRARVRVTRGVPELIAAVHTAGGRIAVVSGGFHEVLDPLAERLGLDAWQANRLGVEDGRLTGRVEGPIVDAATKRERLIAWAQRWAVPASAVVAIGDGANDLLMMGAAGLSIAFDAKPAVRAQADIALAERDLSLVIPALGITG